MTTSNIVSFNGTAYTIESLEAMKGPQLVALHNELAKEVDESPVKRFADKKAAVKRTWKLLEALPAPKQAPVAPKQEPKMTEQKQEAPKAKAPAQPKVRKGTNLAAPGHAPIACREGSKQALLLDTLSRPEGATRKELFLVVPEGHVIPAHRPLKSKPKADARQANLLGEDGQN